MRWKIFFIKLIFYYQVRQKRVIHFIFNNDGIEYMRNKNRNNECVSNFLFFFIHSRRRMRVKIGKKLKKLTREKIIKYINKFI